MFKLFSLLMIIPILFCSRCEVAVDLFSEASMIEIYKDGQILEITEQEQAQFETLFCEALDGARQMPAYGVALDDMTKEAMEEGIWVKFIFEGTHIKSEMPFDSLLIQVEKDISGFNVIRGNNDVYEGRCYYLALEGNLDKVYEFLNALGEGSGQFEVELESQEIKETTIVSEDGEQNDNEDDDEGGENKNSVINLEPEPEQNPEEGKSQQELLNHLQ